MRKTRVCVIGSGINGLICAFYLRRAGHDVTVLEREPDIGGAGRAGYIEIGGRTLTFPLGATLLGQMQRFVFEDLGLSDRLAAAPSPHPSLYAMPGKQPFYFHSEPARFRKELDKNGWSGKGLESFDHDMAKVVAYVQQGFRDGVMPSFDEAEAKLGTYLTNLWIRGSARHLLAYYVEEEALRVILGNAVIESGPVDYSAPGSAFTIPLLESGSVFGGKWGYVWGGMGNLMRTIADVCREAGVRIVTGVQVLSSDPRRGRCSYQRSGAVRHRLFDHLVFGTDPLTADRILEVPQAKGLPAGRQGVKGLDTDGSSGKLVMLFREPVKWKDDTGENGFDSALKFFYEQSTIDELDASSRAVRDGQDFVPGYYEVYPEGAGLRMLGQDRGYDSVMTFFKHLGTRTRGQDLPEVKAQVEDVVLSRTWNGRGALIHSKLYTPADLTDLFHFPRGNIDHVGITTGQTFEDRRYGARKGRSYQFRHFDNVSYCGAGAYPCGSVAGTAGYMCAMELLRTGL